MKTEILATTDSPRRLRARFESAEGCALFVTTILKNFPDFKVTTTPFEPKPRYSYILVKGKTISKNCFSELEAIAQNCNLQCPAV